MLHRRQRPNSEPDLNDILFIPFVQHTTASTTPSHCNDNGLRLRLPQAVKHGVRPHFGQQMKLILFPKPNSQPKLNIGNRLKIYATSFRHRENRPS